MYRSGDRGDTGEKGDYGIKGDTGEAGEKGSFGDLGYKGEKGLPGQPGPRVSEYIIHITNSRSLKRMEIQSSTFFMCFRAGP